MANKDTRWEDNVPGPYYVDKQCVICTTCFEFAPENFELSEAEDHYYVSKQPANDAEKEACQSAVEQCPMGAVGDDGAD